MIMPARNKRVRIRLIKFHFYNLYKMYYTTYNKKEKDQDTGELPLNEAN